MGPPEGEGPFVFCVVCWNRPEASTPLESALSATIALVGLPGAGKTSVAPLLAARLGVPWDDLDARIERECGRSVPELLRTEGEARFRERELRTLESALDGRGVLACGGGTVTNEESRRLLATRATVVWLVIRPETAWDRLGRNGVATRPLLAGASPLDRLRALAQERDPLYRGLATITVETDERDPDGVAAAALTALRARWASSAS